MCSNFQKPQNSKKRPLHKTAYNKNASFARFFIQQHILLCTKIHSTTENIQHSYLCDSERQRRFRTLQALVLASSEGSVLFRARCRYSNSRRVLKQLADARLWRIPKKRPPACTAPGVLLLNYRLSKTLFLILFIMALALSSSSWISFIS
jgi:hypothetical protein